MTFFISLTGLNAAQSELTALSNNIANVGTNGFKKTRVEFGDLVSRSSGQATNSVNGAGVMTTAVKQQFTQGGYQSSSNALDLMIGGQGYFLVKGGTETNDSLALSRNGAFNVDADRWVVDNEGRHLQVLPTTTDGTPTAIGLTALQPLRLPTSSGEPAPTTEVSLVLNLPANAESPTSSFNRTQSDSYNHATSTTIYTADGTAHTATSYYRHIESPTGDTNKYWEVHVFVDDIQIQPTSGPSPEILTFDPNGTLGSPITATAYDNGFTLSHIDSTNLPGPFDVSVSNQDGYAPGRLESVGVDLQGVVRASFSNGETVAIGRIAIGGVPNPNGLKQNGNASWILGAASGELQVGLAAQDGMGTITSGALERSNVDLTEELVGLISAQRNFQANARAIDTASSLLQTIIQLRS